MSVWNRLSSTMNAFERFSRSGSIDLWAIDLRPLAARAQHLFATLSEDEKKRALSYRFREHACEFTAARWALRSILGTYLGIKAAALEFAYSEFGKPEIKNSATMQFNLSHSACRALLAISASAQVGVDLEKIQADFPAQELATRFFSRREQESLFKLGKNEQSTFFFQIWTRKESYLKALGYGLNLELESIDLTPAQEAEDPLRIVTRVGGSRSYFVQSIRMEEGLKAALAYEATEHITPRSFSFP